MLFVCLYDGLFVFWGALLLGFFGGGLFVVVLLLLLFDFWGSFVVFCLLGCWVFLVIVVIILCINKFEDHCPRHPYELSGLPLYESELCCYAEESIVANSRSGTELRTQNQTTLLPITQPVRH